MDITVTYTYQEGYLPTKRHRILRFRNVEKEMVVNIKEVALEDAPVAFIVTEPYLYEPIEYRWVDERLWIPKNWREIYRLDDGNREAFYPVSELIKYMERYHCRFWGCRKDEQAIIDTIIKEASRYMIIGGIVHEKIGEPRYVLMTYGLGFNHGGTSLSIDNRYNVNIGKDRYYNAFQREQAIADTIAVAKGRGDTKYVDGIGCKTIEVLIPEAVRCNPQEEHGDGSPFLNSLEKVAGNAPSATEAGLLVTAFAMAEIGAMGGNE